MARVHTVTHHINVRNRDTDEVVTFAPGQQLPTWAVERLQDPIEPQVLVEMDRDEAKRLAARWEA